MAGQAPTEPEVEGDWNLLAQRFILFSILHEFIIPPVTLPEAPASPIFEVGEGVMVFAFQEIKSPSQ